MLIKLIPVIEITNYDQEIDSPEKGPSLEYPDEWDNYNQKCNFHAGLLEPLIPYKKGLFFYQFSAISDNNLKTLILKETLELRTNEIERENVLPFYGGCILRVDGEDILFPQCCSDLSCFESFESLFFSNNINFYQGHPSPIITNENEYFSFDFVTDESFFPHVVLNKLLIRIEDLKVAVQEAKLEFKVFAERVKRIAKNENLGIDSIDTLLIWGE